MAVFTVTHHQRLDDYAVVQTLEDTDIGIGQSIVLAGLGHGLNGTHTVYAVNPYYFEGVDAEGDLLFDYEIYIGNQVVFYDAGDDLERSAAIPRSLQQTFSAGSALLSLRQTTQPSLARARTRLTRSRLGDGKKQVILTRSLLSQARTSN